MLDQGRCTGTILEGGPMVTCPRCGNDAEYLDDDAFVLIRCEFCGDDIDAADLVPPDDAQAA
jgi:uncharacterized protein (DUF983 family)